MRVVAAPVPWRRGPGRRPDRRPVVLVAVLVAVALAAAGLVVVQRPRDPSPRPAAGDDVPVALAAAFVAGVVTSDADRRAGVLGALVVPERVPAFVAAVDAVVGPRAADGARLGAVPRAYKVVESSDTVRVVLVWARVTSTGPGPATGPRESGEVWGLGLMRTGTRWQVFSYEGTRAGVEQGDPRLDGFLPLLAGPPR